MLNFKNYTNASVFTHWMGWHGTPSHAPFNYTLQDGEVLPYDSSSIHICDDQAAAMVAAGIAGINVDYYGPKSPMALAAVRMLGACERAGLLYSICIDHGALGTLTGSAATSEYIRILNFVMDAFCSSPSYFKNAGRNVVSFFNEPLDGKGNPTVDWASVRAGVSQKLAMIWQGGSGFSHPEADGSFGWPNPLPDPTDINIPAIAAFAAGATANPGKLAFYPTYPGFDDSLASWGKKRIMTRGLDKTLKTTLGTVPKTAQFIMQGTWNDLEEGSNIEERAATA